MVEKVERKKHKKLWFCTKLLGFTGTFNSCGGGTGETCSYKSQCSTHQQAIQNFIHTRECD